MGCEEQWSEHRHVRAPGCYRGDGAGVRGVSGFDAGTSFESTQSIDTAPKPPPTTSAETTIMCTNSSIVVSQPVCGPPPPGECHRYHVVLLRIESRGGNQLADRWYPSVHVKLHASPGSLGTPGWCDLVCPCPGLRACVWCVCYAGVSRIRVSTLRRSRCESARRLLAYACGHVRTPHTSLASHLFVCIFFSPGCAC
jgi:hypothetical protein